VEKLEHRIFDTADCVLCDIRNEAAETIEYRAYNKTLQNQMIGRKL